MRPGISIVVPLYEAEDRVVALHSELSATRATLPPFELLLVDDGSRDATWPRIVELAAADPAVVGVRLARNVGQTGALCAGFTLARGEVVVLMDDDLDTGPAELTRFVDAVRAGAEFASGRRMGTRSPVRHLGSRLYNARLRRWGLPFHDAGCGTNALTRDLATRIAAEGWGVRQHRFKPRVAQLTDRIVEVPFQVRPTSGSHHNVRTLAASWLDVELTFGSLTPGRWMLAAVVAPLVAAATLGRRALRTRRRRGPSAVGAAVLTGGGLAALDLLLLRQRADRRDAQRPPFEVAQVVGGADAGS